MIVGSESIKKAIAGILFAACVLTGVFASGQNDIVASGKIGTYNQNYESIEDIAISGIGNFSIEQGDVASIVVTGDEAYLDSLILTNENGFLKVFSENAEDLDVVITTPNMSSVFLSDSSVGTLSGFTSNSAVLFELTRDSDLTLKGTLTAPEISFYTNSHSTVEGTVNTKSLNAQTWGFSEINTTGIAGLFTVNMMQQSEGHFDGLHIQKANLIVKNDASLSAVFPGISHIDVFSSGEGAVELNMNGVLKANILGESSLTYSGDIQWLNKKVDDDASITAN